MSLLSCALTLLRSFGDVATALLRAHVFSALNRPRRTPPPGTLARLNESEKGFVLKTVSEHASIARFIEDVFGMPRMAAKDAHARDATAGSLLDAFDFKQAPRAPLVLPVRSCP